MRNKAKTVFLTSLLLCVVLGVVAFMYVYLPATEKTEMLMNSNLFLAQRVDELKTFDEQMPENKRQMELMTADIQAKLDNFPVDAKEEDVVALALKAWQEGILVAYEEISIDERQVLGSIPAETVQGAEIDGMDRELSFESRMANYANFITYNDLKRLIECFNANQEELAINEVAYSLNEDTGLLEGYVSTTFYTLQGTDKVYEPKEFRDFNLGVENLFELEKLSQGLSLLIDDIKNRISEEEQEAE
ncbi:MAG: hypothetical protein E7291_07305 [Lachnospiraceae bacterium]|nr:hypothetical protein [Lachnospiraceae bacterium]